MREILFRGKRKDNGEWVYGDLMRKRGPTKTAIIPIEKYELVLVDEETVGQNIGQKDENGTEIFEGDIVRFKRIDALGWTRQRIGQVRYSEIVPVFYILATTGDGWDWCDCLDIEIIGNVFDNPELLEEEP